MGSVPEDSAAAPASVFRSKLPDIEIPRHLSLQAYCFERLPEGSSRPCLIDGQTGAVQPYADVDLLSRRAAAALRGLGVGEGDVVMNLLRNCPEFAFVFLGAARIGAATTTANPFYTPHEIHRQAAAAGARVIVTEACAVEKVRALAADGDFEGCLRLRDRMDAAEPLAADEKVDPDDVAALPCSSGTIGMPKGVMLTHRSLVTSVAQQVVRFAKDMSREFEMSMMGQIKRAKEETFMHQAKYTKDIVKKIKMDGSKPLSMPMTTHYALDADKDGEPMDQKDPDYSAF